eukprot:111359-Pelagomonas_calceolata.AAC.3
MAWLLACSQCDQQAHAYVKEEGVLLAHGSTQESCNGMAPCVQQHTRKLQWCGTSHATGVIKRQMLTYREGDIHLPMAAHKKAAMVRDLACSSVTGG